MGKKRLSWALIISAMFVFFVACSKSESPLATQSPVAVKNDAELAARQTDAKNKGEAKKLEDKGAAIKEVETAFGAITEDSEPSWLKDVRGEKMSPFTVAKTTYPIFLRMSYVLYYFSDEHSHSFGKLSWIDVPAVSKKEAEKNYRETGKVLAKNLVETLKFTREEREHAGQCEQGSEAILVFSQGINILEYVIHILEKIEAEPKEIGMSSSDLRGLALKINKEEIDHWRKELLTRPNSADLQGLLHGAIREAIDAWNFNPKELGLTKEEIALMKPRG